MKDTIKNRIITIIIAIVILFIFFLITYIPNKKLGDKLSVEFPYLKLSDSLNNIIFSTYYPQDWRAGEIFQYVTLENGKKYTIWAKTQSSYNLEILQKPNMRIVKKANNDTIWIFGNEKKYIFIRFGND